VDEKMTESKPEGRRNVGRTRLWLDSAENDLQEKIMKDFFPVALQPNFGPWPPP
jgi:hypothetical protein